MPAGTQRIAFAQWKGGAGKTTLAINVAAELSHRGRAISLIDADPQRSACAWAELGRLPFPVWEIPLDEVHRDGWGGVLDVVESKLVVLDTAPNPRTLPAVVAVSSLLVVPCTPSGLDLEATRQTLEVIEEERRRQQRAVATIIVPNRVDMRTLEGRQFAEELRSLGGVVGPPVGHRVALVRAFTSGQSIGDFARDSMAAREIEQLCSFIELNLML